MLGCSPDTEGEPRLGALDPHALADAWRALYAPSMEEVRSGRRLAAGPAVGAGKPMAEAPAGVRTGPPMAAGRAVVGAGKPMAEVPVRVRTGQPMVVDLAVVGARKPMAAGLAGIGGGQPMAEAMTTGGAGPSMAMVGASCRWCCPMRLNFSIPHPTAEKVTTRIPVFARGTPRRDIN